MGLNPKAHIVPRRRVTYSRKSAVDRDHPYKRRRLSSDNPPASEPSSDLPSPRSPLSPSTNSPPRFHSSKNLRQPRFTLTLKPSSVSKTKPKSRTPRQACATSENLTQLTLDLGQSLRSTCPQCGMSYHPSSPLDAAVHKRFHAKSVGGIDFSPHMSSKVLWHEKDHCILVITPRSSAQEKKKAVEILQVVDSELSAAEIPLAVLWGEERGYKVYVYIVGQGSRAKCVGLLLAERITKGYPVEPDGEGSSSVRIVEGRERRAVMGVARVWTALEYRRCGVAKRLLDTGAKTFVYGMRIEKGLVAFSQPTESGGRLANAWFGTAKSDVGVERNGDGAGENATKHGGWLVYVE